MRIRNAVYTPEASEQRRLRMRLSVAAYTYEFDSESVMTDEEFDRDCKLVRPEVDTGHSTLDKFFREKFSPDTGQWIHDHPELELVEIYSQYIRGKMTAFDYLARRRELVLQKRI